MIDGKRVLIVDDDGGIRSFLSLLLHSEGFRIATAEDGAEGLAKALADPPDAILLDLDMPVLDGREFLRTWRQQPEGHASPVLAMSACAEPPRAGDLGADAFLPKPFEADRLLRELGGLLRHGGGELSALPQRRGHG